MATHASILAWRIPWTEELGGLRGGKESDMTQQLTHTHTHIMILTPLPHANLESQRVTS